MKRTEQLLRTYNIRDVGPWPCVTWACWHPCRAVEHIRHQIMTDGLVRTSFGLCYHKPASLASYTLLPLLRNSPPPELICLLTINPNPNTNFVLNSPTLPQTPTLSPSPDPNHNPHKRRHSRWKLSQELKKANTCYILCKVHMCGNGQS